MRFALYLFLCALWLHTGVSQTQQFFDVKQFPDRYSYSYIWSNHTATQFATNFIFHPNDVSQGFHEIRPLEKGLPYSAEMLTTVAERYDVDLYQTGQGVKVRFTKEQEYLVPQIHAALDTLRAEKLKGSFYNMVRKGTDNIIAIDYVAVVNRYREAGAVMAKGLATTLPKGKRGITEHSLAFIQSIPYSTSFFNDAHFQTPIGMITENKGDCDTKSVSLVTILAALEIRTILLLTPNHMLMGAAIPVEGSDIKIELDGVTYVLFEPAGGGQGYKVGHIAPESMSQLTAQQYEILGPF